MDFQIPSLKIRTCFERVLIYNEIFSTLIVEVLCDNYDVTIYLTSTFNALL